MDTRFWGPSGWRLLHLISFQAKTLNQTDVYEFFKNLPFVLPCKFCRASLSDYYCEDPIPTNVSEYPKWLYRIHNKVNDKLRHQNLLDTPNPNWIDIKTRYNTWLQKSCSKQRMIGWDFLFSVAYTTPCPTFPSSPMPNSPPIEQLNTPELKNRWGYMTREERIPYFKKWWEILPKVLPYDEWRNAWKQVVPTVPSLDGRKRVTSWLFQAEKAMCAKLQEKAPHNSYNELCSELQTFTSGCGKTRSIKVKTCRSEKTKGRSTLKRKRTQMYKATGGYL